MPDERSDHHQLERELGDRYQIVRTLGRGAFGAVYLARERQLHRLVAIKVLHADRAWSDDERTRLLAEARTLANLSHPAVVPLLAFGETSDTVYMVMPYIGGETLTDRLERHAAFDPAEVRRILIEIADALAYIHGEGVLHRDLKPENVLLERAGAVDDDVPPRVRLIDFGVAAFPMRDRGMNAKQETWGTPHFMAPEQIFGEPELDPRSELYSLGVLGFLLLGGRLPFDATSPTERLNQQRKGPIVPLDVCAPNAPKDLVQAIERCLSYDPEQRWRRARELRDVLLRGAEPSGGPAGALSVVRQRLKPKHAAVERLAPGRRRAPDESLLTRLRNSVHGLDLDLHFAARMLAKMPGFTAAIVLTLAIGISATTVMFSAVEALVLRKLAVRDPASLVILRESRNRNNGTDFGATTFRYDRYLGLSDATAAVFTGVGAQSIGAMAFRAEGATQARSITGVTTSTNYFAVLGVRPSIGRFYAADARPGENAATVVLSHEFWQRSFGGSTSALGRKIYLNSRPMTVIGIAPKGFNGAFGSIVVADVWVPLIGYARAGGSSSADGQDINYTTMNVFARLRPGVSPAGASEALNVLAGRVPTFEPETRVTRAWVEPMHALSADLRRPTEQFIAMLFALAALVLVISATNSAGMLLARASARRREMATRMAIGASRPRVARQLLLESTLVCVIGGVAALLLTWWLTRLLNSLHVPFPFQIAIGFRVNGTVLAGTALIVLTASLMAGLAPAAHASTVPLATVMKDGGLSAGRRPTRLRNAFVVTQVAMSVVLLTLGGLFIRSLQRTIATDPGFQTTAVAAGGIDVGQHAYDDARARAFYVQLVDRLRARPDVAGAAIGRATPLSGNVYTWDAGRAGDADQKIDTQWSSAGVGLIEVLRTPLLAGRTFTPADGPDAPRVAVINETLARRLWPNDDVRSVLGRQIETMDRRLTVIGVIGNGKYSFLQESPRAFGYVPLAQRFESSVFLYVRGRADAGVALRAAREELAKLDPNVSLDRPSTLRADVERYLVPQRLAALLVGVFGLVGVLLAMTGLYGVLAFGVTQRLREFGIRLALGARTRDILALVVRQGLTLVVVGVVIGLAGAVPAGRVVSGFLFRLSPTDPLILTSVIVLVVTVAVVASVSPARRGAAADPMTSLRSE